MKWYDLRQYALAEPVNERSPEVIMWRGYMRMLAAGRRPDWPARVFNGWVPKDKEEKA